MRTMSEFPRVDSQKVLEKMNEEDEMTWAVTLVAVEPSREGIWNRSGKCSFLVDDPARLASQRIIAGIIINRTLAN